MYSSDTIVALSTPTGSGAIGVIRLSGENAFSIINTMWKGKNLLNAESHKAYFGRIVDAQGVVIDEVVATLFRAPRSYTKENVVEISCHGSAYIIQKIIQLCLQYGARAAKPGEFTMRAFLNGAFDLSQAEAVADLIASNSAASHQIAMQQMRGGFSNELQKLRTDLIQFAALIELELDFAEEDVEFANRESLNNLVVQIQQVLTRLIRSFEMGNAIKNGVPVVIAGKPNVGKSTLLNALLNEERAIVSDIAGTTRDTIEDELVIAGILFRFIDTAGIRQTDDTIEAQGVERTLAKMKQAKLIIYMVDATQTEAEIQDQIQEIGALDIPYLLLMNKEDLLDIQAKDSYQAMGWHLLSAKHQQGIERLQELLVEKTQLNQLQPDEVIVTNIRHVEAMQHTHEVLFRVQEALKGNVSSDFLAMDIKQSLHYLGEITGTISTDDLLDHIFTKFCIGK